MNRGDLLYPDYLLLYLHLWVLKSAGEAETHQTTTGDPRLWLAHADPWSRALQSNLIKAGEAFGKPPPPPERQAGLGPDRDSTSLRSLNEW